MHICMAKWIYGWICTCLKYCSLVLPYSDIDLDPAILAQVMACCLTASSHYLNQSLITNYGIVTFIRRKYHKSYLSHQLIKLKIAYIKFDFDLRVVNDITRKPEPNDYISISLWINIPVPFKAGWKLYAVNFFSSEAAVAYPYSTCVRWYYIYSMSHMPQLILSNDN